MPAIHSGRPSRTSRPEAAAARAAAAASAASSAACAAAAAAALIRRSSSRGSPGSSGPTSSSSSPAAALLRGAASTAPAGGRCGPIVRLSGAGSLAALGPIVAADDRSGKLGPISATGAGACSDDAPAAALLLLDLLPAPAAPSPAPAPSLLAPLSSRFVCSYKPSSRSLDDARYFVPADESSLRKGKVEKNACNPMRRRSSVIPSITTLSPSSRFLKSSFNSIAQAGLADNS